MSGFRFTIRAFAVWGSVVVGLFTALTEPALADTQYDSGMNPALSASGTQLVEVHQAGDGVGPLWFRTGQVVGQGGNVSVNWDGSQRYDTGVNPAVAVSWPVAIEVHQATSGVGPLWFRLGYFFWIPSGFQFKWYPSQQYDTGVNPAVAISGSRVVEVHQATTGAGPLWYRTAQVQTTNSGPIITWHTSIQYDTGAHPAVSMSPELWSDGTTTVAEVHQTGDGVGPLVFRTGDVQDSFSIPYGGYIEWQYWANHFLYYCGGTPQYDVGIRPALAISSARSLQPWGDLPGLHLLVEHHQGTDGVGPIWEDGGNILAPGFDKYGFCKWGNNGGTVGVHPAIALPTDQGNANIYLVEVHQGQTGVGSLWYSIGQEQWRHWAQ